MFGQSRNGRRAVWCDHELCSLIRPIKPGEYFMGRAKSHYHTVLGDRPVNPSYIDCVWPFSNPSLLWRIQTHCDIQTHLLISIFNNLSLAMVAHLNLSINRILTLRNCLNRPEGCPALSFPDRWDRAVSFGVLSLRSLEFEHCRSQEGPFFHFSSTLFWSKQS